MSEAGNYTGADLELSGRAIDGALRSSDPTVAVLGAIALHLRALAFSFDSVGNCDTVPEYLEDIRNALEDDNNKDSFVSSLKRIADALEGR